MAERLEVVIVHSYHQDYPWTASQHAGFTTALQRQFPGERLDFSVEYLDTKRILPSAQYREDFRRFFRSKHQGHMPRLIYTTDDTALRFTAHALEEGEAAVPVVFSGVNDPQLPAALPPGHYTGVWETKAVAANLALIHGLLPQPAGVVLVGDANPTARAMAEQAEAQLAAAGQPHEIILRHTLNQLLTALRQTPPGPLLLLSVGGFTDDGGHNLPLATILQAIVSSGRPVLGMEDDYVAHGVLGGYVTIGARHGEAAARLAAALLQGQPIATLPPREGPNDYLFDWRTVRRLGVTLPPEVRRQATFIHSPPSFLERHQELLAWFVIALLGLLLLGGAAFVLVARYQAHIIRNRTREALAGAALASQYRKVMDASSIVSKTDLQGRITYVNGAFERLLGYSREELMGRTHAVLRDAATPDSVYRELWQTVQAGETWQRVVKNRTKDGRPVFLDTTIVPIKDEAGMVQEYIATRTDVTQLIRQEELIREQTTDPLTGLPNRVKLLQTLRERRDVRLAMVDIADFKSINDFYGLHHGDLVLVAVAERLRGLRQEGVSAFRMAGDVFTLLAGPEMGLERFQEVVAEMVAHLDHNPCLIGGEEVFLTMTAGIADAPADQVYTRAEQALKRAKATRKSFAVFSGHEDENGQRESNLEWTRKLKSALAEGRIVPYFQVIVHNRTGERHKHEALARLIDEGGKVVSPFFFIDVAKRTRQYGALTRAIIAGSLEAVRGTRSIVSVNLTIEDVRDPEIVAFVREQIHATGVAGQVVLEITESEGIENYDEVVAFIGEMKRLGCQVAIDDFGTGYSNFTHLMRLNADFLKIDGSIIKNICEDQNAQVVVRTLVDFARRLGMETIAEFVSSQDIQDKVTELGVDYSQGFHLGRPEPTLAAAERPPGGDAPC